jgi:hypothetical protein
MNIDVQGRIATLKINSAWIMTQRDLGGLLVQQPRAHESKY